MAFILSYPAYSVLCNILKKFYLKKYNNFHMEIISANAFISKRY